MWYVMALKLSFFQPLTFTVTKDFRDCFIVNSVIYAHLKGIYLRNLHSWDKCQGGGGTPIKLVAENFKTSPQRYRMHFRFALEGRHWYKMYHQQIQVVFIPIVCMKQLRNVKANTLIKFVSNTAKFSSSVVHQISQFTQIV